ncbi:MAG: hypothetical protein ABTD50_11565 [Polyangiaceae bacterium]
MPPEELELLPDELLEDLPLDEPELLPDELPPDELELLDELPPDELELLLPPASCCKGSLVALLHPAAAHTTPTNPT